MEVKCGGLLFTSKFDSGNLARVEKPERSDSDSDVQNETTNAYGCTITPDYEFNVYTKPDCAGTPYENGNRSWFYFGVRGYSPNKLIKLNIVNLNRQGKLYSQGMVPLVKAVPSKPKWERIRDRPTHQMVDGQFVLSFTHRFSENRGGTTYFAFCYPWSYTDCQEALEVFDKKYEGCCDLRPNEAKDDNIYYHRELLCHTLDQRRVDLITITSCENMTWAREPRLEKLFPDSSALRCHRFRKKRIYFLSSRVHPGETPASFVFNGFLKFILREDDPRAQALRRKYVFKMIPLLNPDGVFRGHYRTDQKGINLNRVYLNPDFENHAPIYASRSLVLFYHHYYRVTSDDAKRKSGSSGGKSPQRSRHNSSNSSSTANSEEPSSVGKNDGVSKRRLSNQPSDQESVKDSPYTPFSGEYLSISPGESGIAFYVDLHGHASKRGCFIYGNHIDVEEDQVNNLLYPRLIALNSAHFDFNGCNFTERNMYLKDKRDGMSKEGSGRVAMFKIAGLIHSYTLECNYNTGRTVNCVPPATHDNGRATPPPPAGFPPKYTPETFEEVGRALAVAALDMIQANPWSRIKHSEFTTFENLRSWMLRYVKSSRGCPILPRKMARISTRPLNNAGNSGANVNGNNNASNSVPGTNSTRLSKITNGDSSKAIASSNNNNNRNSNVRNVYNNPQIPAMATYTARMKSNPNLMSSAARRSGNYPQSEFTKRQKNLIRVAVNSNVSNATPTFNGHSPQPIGPILTPMSELHLHEFPNPDTINQDLPAHLNYATNGNKIAPLATTSGPSITSQSNPEVSSLIRNSNTLSLNGSDCNSDSELMRSTPPSLRLSKGTFLKKTANASEVPGAHAPLKSFNVLEGVTEAETPEESVSAFRQPHFVRSVNSSRITQRGANPKGKPPPSRLPVRSRGKPFITPHVSKPPAVLHRGRSISNPHFVPTYAPSFARPTLVGPNTGPTQVVIGSGGTVSIPVNANQANLSRFLSSIDMTSSNPMSASIYTSSSGLVPFQPLSVSQKPLVLPPQKDPELSPSRQEVLIRTDSDKSNASEGSGVQRPMNGANKSAKSRSSSRRGSTTLNGDHVNGSKSVPARKSVSGKKKSKLKPPLRKRSLSKKDLTNGNNSVDENEIGDVPLFRTPSRNEFAPAFSSAGTDRSASVLENGEYPQVHVSDVADYKVVMDVESLHEVSDAIQA